jgi:hypothetical protein
MTPRLFVIALALVLSARFASAQDAAKTAPPQPGVNEELRQELKQMVKVDQDARFKMIELVKKLGKDKGLSADLPEFKELREIDQKNSARMKEIVAKYGWPGKSLVGEDGAQNAWLLVQHADHDRAFQKQCLKLLEEAAKKGEVTKQHVAYLTDRVLVGEGKKQRYGTQFKQENGQSVPQPIEDEANVDKRRAEVGLEPLAEYKKRIEEMYKGKK